MSGWTSGGWWLSDKLGSSLMTGVIGRHAEQDEDDEEDAWSDWMPTEQTAVDVIKAEELARIAPAGDDDEDEDEDDDDEWNPTEQEAVPDGAVEDGEDEEDSDEDWAPQAQGAANVKETEKQALDHLLRPSNLDKVDQGLTRYETKKEADAAGKMLHELKRPPTLMEAKAEIPRGPDVDVDSIPAPSYRDMTQEEGIEMVEKGATVNYHGTHGRAPLHKACENGFPVLCKALCDAGADVDIRDNYGETPLLLLAHCGSWNENVSKARRSETIQMMLSCGADVHAVNPRGRSVLHLACTENDHAAIETFIEGMADVNCQDLAGFSPLMWAAGRDGAETVKMLLDYEADMNIKAARGQTAMTFALTNGCAAIVDILERHKALLDAEEQKRIKEQGELGPQVTEQDELDQTLQLPKPEWACKKEAPAEVEPYQGRRVYMQAKPDRHSNVYVSDS